MIPSLFTLIADSGPTVYITPETVFTSMALAISNSILYGWIASAVLLVVLIGVARRMTIRPKGGFTQIIEVGAEFISNR